MTIAEQLELWVNGKSVHNDTRGECAPDFSCCNSKMKTPTEVRKRFAKAYREDDQKTMNQMLGMFLGEAISTHTPKKVHIVTGDEPTLEQ